MTPPPALQPQTIVSFMLKGAAHPPESASTSLIPCNLSVKEALNGWRLNGMHGTGQRGITVFLFAGHSSYLL